MGTAISRRAGADGAFDTCELEQSDSKQCSPKDGTSAYKVSVGDSSVVYKDDGGDHKTFTVSAGDEIGDVLVAPASGLPKEKLEDEELSKARRVPEAGKIGREKEGMVLLQTESQTSVEEACAPGGPANNTHNSELMDKGRDVAETKVNVRLSKAEVYASMNYNMLSKATNALKGLHGRSKLQAGWPLEDGVRDSSCTVCGSDRSTLKPRSVIIGGKSSSNLWPEQSMEPGQEGHSNLLSTAPHKNERKQQSDTVHRLWKEDSTHKSRLQRAQGEAAAVRGGATVGGGNLRMKGNHHSYVTTKSGSPNTTVKPANLQVFHTEAKDGSPTDGSRMSPANGRKKQVALSTHPVTMSPFHGEQPSHKQKASGIGQGRLSVPSPRAHLPPSPLLSSKTQKGLHHPAIFSNAANSPEVTASDVLMEFDELRSALRAQPPSPTVEPVESVGIRTGSTREQQVLDGRESNQLHELPEVKAEKSIHLSWEEAGTQTLEAVEDGQDIHEVEAAQIIQKHIRGYQTRKLLAQMKQSAVIIQRRWRLHRKQGRHLPSPTANLHTKSCATSTDFTPTQHLLPKKTSIGSTHESAHHGASPEGMVDGNSLKQRKMGIFELEYRSRVEKGGQETEEHLDKQGAVGHVTGSVVVATGYKDNLVQDATVSNDALKPITSTGGVERRWDDSPNEFASLVQHFMKRPSWQVGQVTTSSKGYKGASAGGEDGGGRKRSLIDLAKEMALEREEKATKDFVGSFQAEIDRSRWLAAEMAELSLGDQYTPRKVLLISDKIPKCHSLAQAALPNVITIVYDYQKSTFTSLLNDVHQRLEEYMKGAKIQSLAISCKGSPGCFYLLTQKPVTPAKLAKHGDLRMFWKIMGSFMSCLSHTGSSLHLLESNCAGNKQGEELMSLLSECMHPAIVSVENPLEVSKQGREMIETYFSAPAFKLWKSTRYTKLRLF